MNEPRHKLFDIDVGPTDEGREVIEVSAFYSKGGINYFNYKQEPRGYYVMVTPCVVGDGFRTYAITANSRGFKQILEGCKRLNRKRLEWYCDAIQFHADRDALRDHVLAGNKAEAFVEIMRSVERRKAA